MPNLTDYLRSGVGPTQEVMVWEELGTFDGTSADIQFDIANASDYDRIEVTGQLRSTRAADNDTVQMYLNGDAINGNYHYQRLQADNGTSNATENNSASIAVVSGGTSTVGAYSSVKIEIDRPGEARVLNAIGRSGGQAASDSDLNLTTYFYTRLATVAALTQINIVPFTGPNLDGELTVRGLKKVAINNVGQSLANVHVWEEIAAFDGTSASETINFTDIAQYSEIVVAGSLRSAAASINDWIYATFNGDSTLANYRSQVHYGAGTSSVASAYVDLPRVALVAAASSPANADGQFEFTIKNPGRTQLRAIEGAFGYYQQLNTSLLTGRSVNTHETLTTALSSLTLSMSGGANFTGKYLVRGLRKRTILLPA